VNLKIFRGILKDFKKYKWRFREQKKILKINGEM